MKLLQFSLANLLALNCAYSIAATNVIKPEETPLHPEAALKMEDVPPTFARPFTPKASVKDDKLASSEAELYQDGSKEQTKQQAENKVDDGFPTPTEEARRLSNLPPTVPSAKDNKEANSSEELTQEKWVDAEPLEKHAENNVEQPKGPSNNVTKDDELFKQAFNESMPTTIIQKSDNSFSIEPNKPVVQEFNPEQAMKNGAQFAENNNGKSIKELGS